MGKKEFFKYAGAILVCLSVVGFVSAASTISTNISTGGTLSVTGASTLTGLTTMGFASSTLMSVHNTAYFGGTATTTVNSAGNVTVGGTLTSTAGLNTLGNASTTILSASTMASTSQLVIGGNGTALDGAVSGVCGVANVTIAATTTAMVSCIGATGIRSGDRVFVTATSSLPANFIIQAASSTAATVIQVNLMNTGSIGGTSPGPTAFYYWATR